MIEGKTFKDLGAGVIAIRIENCSNVTIRSVDFMNVAEGVYALNSSNIKIIDSRYSNITGPAQPRTGANVANFVQFNNVAGGLIDHNKGKGGDTEDIVSVYQSDHVIVEDNHFEGTNWTSASGSGIALADGGGSYNVAQRNILLNPGQVGIFIAGGLNNKILGNTIYGEQRVRSNVGLYVWNQSSSPCSGQEVTGNRVYWRNAAGARTRRGTQETAGPSPVGPRTTGPRRSTSRPFECISDRALSPAAARPGPRTGMRLSSPGADRPAFANSAGHPSVDRRVGPCARGPAHARAGLAPPARPSLTAAPGASTSESSAVPSTAPGASASPASTTVPPSSAPAIAGPSRS